MAATGTGPFVPPIDDTLPLHERVLEAVALTILNLNLSGVTLPGNSIGANVYVKGPEIDDTDITFPAVIVAADGNEEILPHDSFESRAWGYPVAVLICDRQFYKDPKARPDLLSWRHDAMVAFDELPANSNPMLPDVPECFQIDIRPRAIFAEQIKQSLTGRQDCMLLCEFGLILGCMEARKRPVGLHL